MDTSVFISGQLIPIRMVSSPLSPSGECEGEKTELSPLSPLKGMRGGIRGGSGVVYFISYLLPVSSTTRRQ